jgi:hypothetical protein
MAHQPLGLGERGRFLIGKFGIRSRAAIAMRALSCSHAWRNLRFHGNTNTIIHGDPALFTLLKANFLDQHRHEPAKRGAIQHWPALDTGLTKILSVKLSCLRLPTRSDSELRTECPQGGIFCGPDLTRFDWRGV